jgi:hypothetical protein
MMTLFQTIQDSCGAWRISACVDLECELGVAVTGPAPSPEQEGAQMLPVFLSGRLFLSFQRA